MNKTFFKIILFVLPLFPIIIFIESEYRSIPNDYSYKSQYIENKGNLIELLILGNSHTLTGINPDYFNRNCFNFSMNYQSINYHCFILKKYIDKLPNLQYLIIPISYPTLTKTLEDGIEYWRKYRYIYYMDYEDDNPTLQDKISLNRYLFINQLTRISLLKRLWGYWFNNQDNIFCRPNGWVSLSVDNQENLKKSAKEAAQRHESPSFDVKVNMKYLNDIISLGKRHNFKILLVTPPATSYIEYLDSNNIDLINHTCDSTAKQYTHVRYINFLNDSAFTDSLFKDGDHLNNIGAKVWSQKLNKIIKQF